MYFSSRKKKCTKFNLLLLKVRLESNWAVVYITATEPLEKVRRSMQDFGIDIHYYDPKQSDGKKSLVILRGEDLYKNPEKPDIENWVNSAKSLSEVFISQGKVGVRVAADLSSYFLSRGLLQQWHDLEYALEKNLSSLPLSVLCAYDARVKELWDIDVLKFYRKINQENKEFVDAHSFAIYASNKNSVIYTV